MEIVELTTYAEEFVARLDGLMRELSATAEAIGAVAAQRKATRGVAEKDWSGLNNVFKMMIGI